MTAPTIPARIGSRTNVPLPAGVSWTLNGQVPASMLRQITIGGTVIDGHRAALKALDLMAADCFRATGAQLRLVSAGDDYRTLAMQLIPWNDRMLPYYDENVTTTTTRTYQGKTWWLKKGKAPISSPGGSFHGLAIAFDVCWVGPTGQPLYVLSHKTGWAWLLANAARYGFLWEYSNPVTPEPWHIVYVAGDATPEAVAAAEAAADLADVAAALKAAKRTRLVKGARGDAVKWLQIGLKNAGVYNGDTDGRFGPVTEHALNRFRKLHGWRENGVAGRRVWRRLFP